MLVLTRRPQQRVFIGEDIEIVIVSISRNQVKIGINAPDNMNILREEIKDKNEEKK